MARLDRVGPKGHGDSFDLQAGLIGGQRSDAKAVNDLAGEMQGKKLGVDLEEMEKGYKEAVAVAFAGWERPQDKMQTGKELSESEDDGVMQRVGDFLTPKYQRDHNRRLRDEASLREEARQVFQSEPEPEEEDWEEVADIDDSAAWGRPAQNAQLSPGDILEQQAAIDEHYADEE